VTLGLTIVAALAAQATTPEPATLRAELHDYMDRAAAFGFTGAVLAAVDGERLLARGYGLANRAQDEPVTTTTIFDIGSLSKQFTAAAVLRACQNGDLTLDTTLAEVFDEVPADQRDVRIAQLLSHTSGLPYHATRRLADGASDEAVVASLLLEPIEPGAVGRFQYSNVGYTLLAYVLAEVTERPFDEYLLAEVLAPAGLRSTGLVGSTRPAGRYARSYFQRQDGGSPADWELTPGFLGSGGVLTTLDDLWMWERALTSETVLTDRWRAKLFEPHVEIRGPEHTYGFGWMASRTARGTRVVFHDGDFNGFNASYRRYVDEGVTLILLSNVRPGAAGMREAVLDELSLLIQGEDVVWPPAVVEADAPSEAWIGRWVTEEGRGLVTTVRDGRLVVAGDGPEPAIEALATGAPPEAGVLDRWERSIQAALGPALRGDDDPLAAITSPAVVGGLADALRRLIEPRLPEGIETGEVFGWFDVEGSRAVGRAGEGETIVRLGPDADGLWSAWRWTGGGLLTIRAVARPARVELRPVEANRYAFFDLFSDCVLTLEHGEDGSLVIEGPGGRTTAQRR